MVKTAILQTAILFVLIGLGFVLTRIGMINEERKKGLSDLLVNVVTPAVIIDALQAERTGARMKGLLFALGFGIIYFLLAILIAQIAIRKTDRYEYRTLRFAAIYQNCGYMGIPFVQGVFGTKAVFYVTPMIVLLNFFGFTHGLTLMRNQDGEKPTLKEFITPVMICIVIGLTCFFGQIHLPSLIARPIEMMGALNTPLGMLIAGASICTADLRNTARLKPVARAVLLRLVVIPLVFTAILLPIPVDPLIRLTLIVTGACPTASLAIVMAVHCERDEELAAEAFAISTILSIVTLPALLFLVGRLGLTI